MNDLLNEQRFFFISDADKAFLLEFDAAMTRLGYESDGKIGSGYCWGKYMLIYTKAHVKSKRVYARIYIRDAGIVLRLFFNNIDEHRAFLENAPDHIKQVFTGAQGECQHCHNEKTGQCRFRKTYTLNDRYYEKCNGIVFEFSDPDRTRIRDYLDLFCEFYPARRTPKVV